MPYFIQNLPPCNLVFEDYILKCVIYYSSGLNTAGIVAWSSFSFHSSLLWFWIKKENIVALLQNVPVMHSPHIFSTWVLFLSVLIFVKNKRGIFSTLVTSFLVPSGAWIRLDFYLSRKLLFTKVQWWGPHRNAQMKRWDWYKDSDCMSECLNTCDSG